MDVQNDFVDGTLAIRDCPAEEEGADVVPVINHLLETCDFDVVVYSLDWHPKDHISFVENVSCRKLHHSSKVSVFFISVQGQIIVLFIDLSAASETLDSFSSQEILLEDIWL